MVPIYKDVDAFNQTLKAEAAWVFGGGLHPPETATVVRIQGRDVLTTDGVFAESKEQLGGFWIINARPPPTPTDLRSSSSTTSSDVVFLGRSSKPLR